MRSKPKVVNTQICRTLVHHLTNYVYFDLNKEERKNKHLMETTITCISIKSFKTCTVNNYVLFTLALANVMSVNP